MHGINYDSPAQLIERGDSDFSKFQGPKTTTVAFRLIAALWLIFVLGGAALLNLHATTPGQQKELSADWPLASRIARDTGGATFLVFVHPYCPCARTTLGELAAIMNSTEGHVTAHVVFVVPDGENPDWTRNELWQAAQAIPDVRIFVDYKAAEAKRFGARTSGLTLLFNERGTCLFSGGITASRGHAGQNSGRQAVVSCLAGVRREASCDPTFGCPLFAEESTIMPEGAQ